MDNTHTAALLSLLDKSELTALGKFLKSPFFTAKKHLPLLFAELREAGQWTIQSPKDVFPKLFDGEAFDDHKWNKALSDLNSCICDFLAVRQFIAEPQLRAQADVSIFFKRHNKRAFKHAVDTALGNKTKKAKPETAEGWHLRFWTLKYAASYILTDRTKSAGQLLNNMGESIDLYYFISKLQLACNHASSAQVLNLKSDQAAYQQLLEQTEGLEQSGKSAMLILYRALLRLLTTPEPQFEPFFALLQHQGPRLERGELESVVRLALNFCIHRYHAGKAEAFEQYRQVFNWADGQQTWTVSATAEDCFLNDGVMFAKSRDVEGFEAFLEKGKNALPKRQRKRTVLLLRAHWHFYQAEFSAATLLLNQWDSRHPRHSLRFHTLKVCNTYEEWRREQVESNDLERALRSFKEFLQHTDLFSKYKRQSYRNLIWFIQKMAQHGQKRGLSKEQLQAELEKRQLAAPDWVAAKIGELP